MIANSRIFNSLHKPILAFLKPVKKAGILAFTHLEEDDKGLEEGLEVVHIVEPTTDLEGRWTVKKNEQDIWILSIINQSMSVPRLNFLDYCKSC